LKIFRAHPVTDLLASATVAIPAKDGALALDEVQLEGKRRMSAAEFRRGWPGQLVVE
jgi:methionyl-tRNA formyltransferase